MNVRTVPPFVTAELMTGPPAKRTVFAVDENPVPVSVAVMPVDPDNGETDVTVGTVETGAGDGVGVLTTGFGWVTGFVGWTGVETTGAGGADGTGVVMIGAVGRGADVCICDENTTAAMIMTTMMLIMIIGIEPFC